MNLIYESTTAEQYVTRISNITPDQKVLWGKMNPEQVLAHLNVMFDMAYTDSYPKSNVIKIVLLKLFVKQTVVGPKPYKRNIPTAPEFIISKTVQFEDEKQKLINAIRKVPKLGSSYFEGKESLSFGKLTALEWHQLFSKHIEHHLQQLGV